MISEIMIEQNQNPSRAIKLLNSVSKNHSLNPVYFRLLSKAYSQTNDLFNSNIHLSEYYIIMGNHHLASEVLLNTSRSNKISVNQKVILDAKRRQILCTYNRPLEPIFGEKTCN